MEGLYDILMEALALTASLFLIVIVLYFIIGMIFMVFGSFWNSASTDLRRLFLWPFIIASWWEKLK